MPVLDCAALDDAAGMALLAQVFAAPRATPAAHPRSFARAPAPWTPPRPFGIARRVCPLGIVQASPAIRVQLSV
jgi:hypothetical protein